VLQRTTRGRPPAAPLRPLRILIEDPALVLHGAAASIGLDVATCAGPCDAHEVCPLVTEGRCPMGSFDVVVSALHGPWARSVLGAWQETGTPVVEAAGVASADPGERFAHHVGAAMQELLAPLTAPTTGAWET
jgi:hypothetical protein